MKDQRNSEISRVSQALKTITGGINSGQIYSRQRYLYLMIPFQGRTIEVGALDAVSRRH